MKNSKEKIRSFQKLNKKINPEIYDYCKSLIYLTIMKKA